MRLFLSTGELSGDYHASFLVRALRAEAATRGIELTIAAIGSEHQRPVVDELWEDTHGWAGIGILDSLRRGPKVTAGYARVLKRLRAWQPDLVIAVDYRVFNVTLLKNAKALGAQTVYYFPPVQWGIAKSKARDAMVRLYEGDARAKKKPDRFDRIAASADLVLLTYPISEGEYRRSGANVHYIGHPLWNALQAELHESPDAVRARYGLPPMRDAVDAPLLIGIFPGSRDQELRDLWPVLRDWLAAEGARWPQATWLVSIAHSSYRARLTRDIARLPVSVRARVSLIEGMDPNLLQAMDLVLMKSGTAAQTALLLGVPMVTFYRVGMPPVLGEVLWNLSKMLFINLPFWTFPNLLAGRGIVPELIQEAFTPQRLGEVVTPLLQDPSARAAQRAELETLREQLIRPDALTRAAAMCLDLLAARHGSS